MEIVPAPPTAQAAALTGFRQALHATMDSWADALFELTDATLCAGSPVLRDGLDGTGGDTWVETDVMSRMSGVRSCGRARVRTATVPTA